MMIFDSKLNSAWTTLKIAIGLCAFLAGLDKFFNLLTNWSMYLSSFSQHALPISPGTFMHMVGIIEMIVGLAILTRWTRIGAYIASAWLVLIAANLVTGSFFDLAVRDIEIAIAAFVLARLTEVRQVSDSPERSERVVLASRSGQSAENSIVA